MAVVTKYGTGYKDPTSLLSIAAALAEGTLVGISSRVDVAAGDSIGSVLKIGKMPSNAVIKPSSAYRWGATGVTDLDIGFAYPGGAVIDPDALVNADDISVAGN